MFRPYSEAARCDHSFLAVPVFLLLILPVSARLEAAGVDLELVTEQGFPLTGPQRWIETFQGLEVQLRIRAATPGDRVQVTKGGTDAAPVYHVVGMLTRQDTLIVPGGRFTARDRAGIAAWVERVRRGGWTRTAVPGPVPSG